MNTVELLILIIAILSVICIITADFLFYYKNKYDYLDFKITYKNIKMNNMQCLIDTLQEEIKKLKEPEKIFKIEKVVMLPKEITCKFEISNRLAIKDVECLKRHAFDALADYIIREYDNNPSLFNIQQKQDPITNSTNFTLNVRLLPYPEQSETFETLCKEMEEQS